MESTIIQEVTAQSERERRVYLTMLSNTADMNYVLAPDGRFTYANAPLLQFWNRTMDEVLGRTLGELGHVTFVAELFTQQVAQVVATGKPVRHETPYEPGSGRRTFEYILMPVFDTNGNVEAIAGSSRDTTERRAAEVAVRDEARRKDEFIATLAHELRNPLAPIRNALEVARLAKGNDVAVEYAHGVMERQMTHMVRLIDDLLDLSRLNLGKIELKRNTVDLGAVLESAVETARPHIEHAGHELKITLSGEPLCVDGDITRLGQVFANLLTNAAKFTGQNGRLWVTAEREGDWAVVSVKDNGIGMTQSTLEHVFDMFIQEVDALDRTESGLGIGLTLVKGLVQLHGGTVDARSEGKGLGSEFIVRLPLASAPQAAQFQRARHAPAASTNWHRILVVDDNVDSATSLSMMLNFMGHDTRTANDGVSGLQAAELFRPNVCLLDIGMPNLNGFEMARRLREQPWGRDVFLIALSGWGQEHDKVRSTEAGFDLHLVKPIDPTTLGNVLSKRISAA